MPKKKIYAVKIGKSTGIFRTWEECKASVDGYPGAQYKGFATEEEANLYLSGSQDVLAGLPLSDKASPGSSDKQADLPFPEEKNQEKVIAYVDGSFEAKIGRYSFGCVFLLPGGEIIRKSGSGENPESVALRNVTGEMLGAMFAVKWCEKNGYPAVEICYDYSGIEMWAMGKWKTNNILTEKYAVFMKQQRQKMKISFRKIAAHTGDKNNEEADQLAKEALVQS